MQATENQWPGGAGMAWIAWVSATRQLHRCDQVHDELRKGRDVPAARRILEADDQLLTERTPDLHEGLD